MDGDNLYRIFGLAGVGSMRVHKESGGGKYTESGGQPRS